MAVDLLYLRDAYVTSFTATVTAVDADGRRVALDRTAFHPTGGGQPHDTGTLGGLRVTEVRKEGEHVWHTVDGDPPAVGSEVEGEIDWERRHQLMRTQTALHVLCGVIWNEWGKAVTGGNMEPLSARMDFEFDPLPEGFGVRVEELVNAELAAARPIAIEFLPRDAALEDEDLIRTKVRDLHSFHDASRREEPRRVVGECGGSPRVPRATWRRSRTDTGRPSRAACSSRRADLPSGRAPQGTRALSRS